MGAENSKLRASSLRLLRTLSGRKYSSKFNSSENLSRSNRKKNSSSRQQSTGSKPKSDSVRSKTKWPYPHVEKDFLPVYSMKAENQNDFTIVNIIASGAYGSVLRGLENKTKRDVAIKVIDKSRVLSEGQGAIQQCKDEVLIQSELPHSMYIVQLVSFWQTRNRLYLVLEYIHNGELFDLWKSVRIFSESFARFYLSEICMAMEFLHQNNVVYRDLKMENVLLDSEAHIKIIDFGLSKKLALGDRTSTTCGTLQYTAPEVLRGEPYDHTIDWWSLGILGYALLNGKFPVFGAKNHIEMRALVTNHQYRMPIHLSNEAADVLTMLLQKNSKARIKSLEDLTKARYFKGCLNCLGPRLELRKYLMEEDLAKVPDSFHLKPYFEMVFADSMKTMPEKPVEVTEKIPSKKVEPYRPKNKDQLMYFDDVCDSPVMNAQPNRNTLHLKSKSSPLRNVTSETVQSDILQERLPPRPLYSVKNNHQQLYSEATDNEFTLPRTFDTYPRVRNI